MNDTRTRRDDPRTRRELLARERELMERCDQLLEERRANSRRSQVAAFHSKYGHPIGSVGPAVPDEKRVRFRLKLDIEETLELYHALIDRTDRDSLQLLEDASAALGQLLLRAKLKPDLADLADALGDGDYVREGTRLEFGIDGEPIARLIHEANMKKGTNGPDGKPVKNPDWQPPDIAGELERQRRATNGG